MAKKPPIKEKPKEKPEPQKWLDAIKRAQDVKKNWRDRFRVDLAYEYWEGVQRPNNIPADEWITVNLIYSSLAAELPSLYSQDPYYHLKVKRSFSPLPEDAAMFEEKTKLRAAMLNYLKTECNLKTKSRLSIFDAHFQYGIIQVAHENDWVDNPNAGNAMFAEDGTVMFDDQENMLLEPEKYPENESFVVNRIHPDDHLVDEDATPLEYNWTAIRIRERLEDAKKNEKYRTEARDKLVATEISEDEKDREKKKKGQVTDKREKDPDLVVSWQIWDVKNNQHLIVSEGCGEEFLIAPTPLPPGIEGDPFIDLRFVLRPDSWYPLPPVSQWIDSQREYCEARSKVLVHRKRFNRKYEMYSPGFDDDAAAAAKLEIGEDGTVLLKNQPQACVTPINDAPLDQQVHTELAYLRQDFAELAVGANQRGAGYGISSATEAGIVEKRSTIREGDRVALVSDFLGEIGRKLDQLVQANLTEEYAIKVTGTTGESWQRVRPQDYQDIMGEFDVTVVVGSHTPQLPEIERAQMMNMLSLLLPNLAVIGMMPQTVKLVMQTFQIGEQQLSTILEEFAAISQQMQAGAVGQPGQQGSLPGVGESRAQSAMPGMAAGINNVRGGLQ
jgi:hypothetical protein